MALFNRVEARDFADVFVLAQQFDNTSLLEWASQIDPGFDRSVLRDMFGMLKRFTDEEIPIDSSLVARLRTFFESWSHDLPATYAQ